MERIKLYCRGVCRGEAILGEDGRRMEIRAEMEDPGDGLYRAVLQGDRGELSLGVMEPREGLLVLRRRPERCEVEHLGKALRVQVSCAFSFRKRPLWTATEDPASLLQDDFLRTRLVALSCAYWRTSQGRRLMAFPLREGTPFPLEPIFCFARIERVENEICAVYAFDENGQPVQPGWA